MPPATSCTGLMPTLLLFASIAQAIVYQVDFALATNATMSGTIETDDTLCDMNCQNPNPRWAMAGAG